MNSEKDKCANLIVAGFGKAGTTSLFEYLITHPEVCGSSVKETKFFMAAKFNKPIPPLSEYNKFWKHYKGEKYRLDASPSYGFGGEAIAKSIAENLGQVKIIFILREPVSKVFSWYRYIQSTRMKIPTTVSFEQFLKTSFDEIDLAAKEFRDTPYSKGVSNGLYMKVLPAWYNHFGDDNIRLFFYDDLKRDTRKFVHQVCDWLQIDASLISSDNYNHIANKTMIYRSGRLHLLLRKMSALVPISLKRKDGLYKRMKRFYNMLTQKERHDTLRDETKSMLHDFYKPHNAELAKFLRGKNYKNLPWWLNEN